MLAILPSQHYVSVLAHIETHMSVNPSETCGTAIISTQLNLAFTEREERRIYKMRRISKHRLSTRKCDDLLFFKPIFSTRKSLNHHFLLVNIVSLMI